MTAEVEENSQNTTKTFNFSFPSCTSEEAQFKLEVPVVIPHDGCTRELVQRLIKMFHIPVYLEDELNEKLAAFVCTETRLFHNERDARLLDRFKNNEVNVEGVVRNWEKLFKENVSEFAEQKGMSDEEVFAEAYHRLLHSPALETILQVESSYARTVLSTLRSRDEDLKKLTDNQTEAEETEASGVRARWSCTLGALHAAQRAAHRRWLLDALQRGDTTPFNSPLGSFSPPPVPPLPPPGPGSPDCPSVPPVPVPVPEESFTIHVGSQLKQTHNVRLRAADVIAVCKDINIDHRSEWSRRLATSLALYSSELSGAVVLHPAAAGLEAATLAAAAERATDHHFPHLHHQLRDIEERIKDPVYKRNKSAPPSPSPPSGGESPLPLPLPLCPLRAGDVYITRHSNIADVHVVFHLVVDDTVRSGDITSRHPAILGIRNILKAACNNDVTTVSLPLLLTHRHSEEMTASWCVRRAELVLKCVKGFVLEGAACGGAHIATINFIVPPDTSADVFTALAHLLPNIFRLSNPVKVKLQQPL